MSNGFDPGNLPDNTDTLGGALGSKGIQLPFPAPLVWWKNGAASLAQLGDSVLYHGGWAVSVEELERTNLPAPENFQWQSWSGREGNTFDVHAARRIGFAPIATREGWFDRTDRQEGGQGNGTKRLRLQMLGVLGVYDTEAHQYLGYGPVVLSSTGYAAEHVRKALKDFETQTGSVRAKLVAGRSMPANMFYATIGTFSEKPVFEMAGKTQKSPITPCAVMLPKELSPQYFQAIYVGSNTIEQMIAWKEQAQEWLDAWKKPDGDGRGNQDTGGKGGQDFDFQY